MPLGMKPGPRLGDNIVLDLIRARIRHLAEMHIGGVQPAGTIIARREPK